MSEFQRGKRYIVIKCSDIAALPEGTRKVVTDYLDALGVEMDNAGLPQRTCVVVESDWPEYELVWRMIEHPVTGKPLPNYVTEHALRLEAEARYIKERSWRLDAERQVKELCKKLENTASAEREGKKS